MIEEQKIDEAALEAAARAIDDLHAADPDGRDLLDTQDIAQAAVAAYLAAMATKGATVSVSVPYTPTWEMLDAGGFIVSGENATRWKVMRKDDKDFCKECALEIYHAMLAARPTNGYH